MNKLLASRLVLVLLVLMGHDNFLTASQDRTGRQFLNISSLGRNQSESRSFIPSYRGNEDKCKAVGASCCTLLVVGAILGGVLGSMTYTHVRNDSGQYCEIRYPGCSEKDSDGNTRSVDCIRRLYNGDRTTISHIGDLSRLCATDTWGFDRGCATQDALQGVCHDFSVGRKNGHFSFSRDCGDQTETYTNSTSSGVFFSNRTNLVNVTSQRPAVVTWNNQDIVQHYLRGTKK